MLATDPPPSQGLRRLDAVLHRQIAFRCHHRGRHGTCYRTVSRHVRAKAIGAGHYLVVVKGLKPVRYVLSLRAVDRAGHEQRRATAVALRGKQVLRHRRR